MAKQKLSYLEEKDGMKNEILPGNTGERKGGRSSRWMDKVKDVTQLCPLHEAALDRRRMERGESSDVGYGAIQVLRNAIWVKSRATDA